jgi:hypothetical protein
VASIERREATSRNNSATVEMARPDRFHINLIKAAGP